MSRADRVALRTQWKQTGKNKKWAQYMKDHRKVKVERLLAEMKKTSAAVKLAAKRLRDAAKKREKRAAARQAQLG